MKGQLNTHKGFNFCKEENLQNRIKIIKSNKKFFKGSRKLKNTNNEN